MFCGINPWAISQTALTNLIHSNYYAFNSPLHLPGAWANFDPDLCRHASIGHNELTHLGSVEHTYVGNLTTIGSDNGLSPGRRQAIIWTNTRVLLIGPLGTNFNEILIEIHTFSLKKINFDMSYGKWGPFCLGLSVLRHNFDWSETHIWDFLVLYIDFFCTFVWSTSPRFLCSFYDQVLVVRGCQNSLVSWMAQLCVTSSISRPWSSNSCPVVVLSVLGCQPGQRDPWFL